MQHSKVLYRWGVRRRGETGRRGKVGVKRKWWVLAQLQYSLQENGRNHRTRGIDHLTRRRAQGPGILKNWEYKRDGGRIPDTFT